MVENEDGQSGDLKKNHFSLYVDADACPVKDEIMEVAEAYNIAVTFVASYNHYSYNREGHWVMVDPDREAADLYIVNHVKSGDIVITWDMGLAGLLTNRGVHVLTPNGKKLKDKDMPEILHFRYVAKMERLAERRVKGPKPFTKEDRQRFKQSLTEMVTAHDTYFNE